ncbi:MAG: DUF3570 domain-containing protein [Polyangiaceae bacterium]
MTFAPRGLAAWAAAAFTVSLAMAWPASARDQTGKPAAAGAHAGGDFTHTPANEGRANTPVPVYVEYGGTEKIARVIVKYKGVQMEEWRRLDLKHLGGGWGGLIPCGDVLPGPMRYYVQGFDEGGDAVSTSGDPKDPFIVPILDEFTGDAPHLPGLKPPRRCSERNSRDDKREDSAASSTEAGKESEKSEKAEKTEKRTTGPHKGGEGLEDTASERASIELAAYNDSDHVTVVTPSVNVGIDNVSGASLNGSYLVDVVSAASVDIVSTASSRWQEVRQAGTVSGLYKPHDFGVGVGGSVSREPDYLSYGGYALIVKDFEEKNWTTTFGYGASHDTIGRCGAGGACTPFSVFSRDLSRGSFNGGLAFVIDRISLASVTLDVVIENGDQSKPYRYIPMFSPGVAPTVPKGASIAWVNANRLPERPLEQLPLERHRAALTGRYARRLDGSTLRLEERFYDDDWGLVASTTDARWIFDLGSRFEIWPHARFHAQTSVTFWQRAYVSESATGWNLPEYRTGDRELGPLWTFGGGLGARWYLGRDTDPQQWTLQLTWDGMYTSFLDDLYVTERTATLGALTFMGQL